MFAIAPIVILTVFLAGLLFGEAAANGWVAEQLRGTVGPQAAEAMESIVHNASNPSASKWATLLGLLIAWQVPRVCMGSCKPTSTPSGRCAMPRRPMCTMLRERLFSFGMVLATGFLLLVSLIVTTALNAVAGYLTPASLPGGVWLWQAINALVSFAFITLLFALLFKVVPDVHVPWRTSGVALPSPPCCSRSASTCLPCM